MAASDVLRTHKTFNSGAANAATGVFITIDIAGMGIAPGDQLIVAIQLRENATALSGWEAPAGWTLRAHPTQSSGSFYVYTAKYGTDVTGTSWTWDNGVGNTTSTRWAAEMLALRGATASGVAAVSTAAVSSSSTSWSTGSLTTTGSAILVGLVGARNNGGTSWVWPLGWVEEDEDLTQTTTNAVTIGSGVLDTTPVSPASYSLTVTGSASGGTGAAALLAYTYTVPASGAAGSSVANWSVTTVPGGAAAFSESFESGSSGAPITTATTAFTSVDPGWTFTNSPRPAGGSLAAQVSVPESTLSMLRRTRTTTGSPYYYRFYLQIPSYPLTANGLVYVKSASTVVQSLRLGTTGQLQLRDGSTTRWSSNPLPRNEWVRVEVAVDSVAMTIQMRLFTGTNVNGPTADQDSGLQTLTTPGPTQITWGVDNGGSSSYSLLLDELGTSTTGWLGKAINANGIQNTATAGWSAQVAAQGHFVPPTTPALLARVTVAPTGISTTSYSVPSIAAKTTYDLRGAEFQGYFWADSIFGFGQFSDGNGGNTATTHQRNNVPIELGGTSTPTTELAVIGGKVIGDQPTTLTWEQMKHGSPTQAALDAGTDSATVYASVIVNNQNQDGDPRIHVANGSWAVIDGLRVYNTHDGLGLQGAGGGITADSGRVYVRNLWVYQNHDDSIENDLSYLQLHVDDSLFEQCYNFISCRAGVVTGAPVLTKTQTVTNSIVWLMPRGGPHKQPSSVQGHGGLYKMQDNSPGLVVSNTIFACEKAASSGAGTITNRPGLDFYSNVTIVWLGTGSYPYNVPQGCTVTYDRSVLDTAVAKWKQRHGVTDFNTINAAQMIAPVSNRLTLGTSQPGALRIGSQAASKAYLGNTLLWP